MAGQEVGSAYVKVGSQPDSKFKSNIENAMPSGMKVGKSFVNGFKAPVGQLASWFKGGAVIGAFSSITSAAMSSISSSMDSAIARADTLANFPKVMQTLGYSAEASAKSTEIMKAAVDGLPTRLQDMTSNVQVLAATMGNLADGEVNASTVGRAFNDMMLAGGQSTDIANNAFTQYSQMLAAGKVDQQAWNSVVMAAPGQVNQLAKSLLGASANQKTLYEALKTGKVSFDQFNAAVVKLDNEGGEGFASFREQAENASKGIATSMSNAKNAVSNQLANIIGKINENGEIAGIFDGIKANINNFGAFFVTAIDTIKSSIDFEGFKAAFDGVGAAVAAAFGSEGAMSAADFGNLIADAINMAIPVIQVVTPLIGALASAFKVLCDNASWLVPVIAGLVGTMMLINGAMSAVSFVNTFASGLMSISAAAGPAVGALTTLAGSLQAVAGPMVQVGVAVLAMGGGLLLAGAGFALLALSAVQLASAGPGAVAVMVGMVAAIAGLAAGAAFLGPALVVAAPGMIAFGAAVALVGAGVMLASAGIVILATQLPLIAAYGASAGVASIALGSGLMVLGAGALVAGVGCIVLGAGLAVCAPGLLVASAAALVLGAAMTLIGAGAMMAGAGCAMMGESLPVMAESAAPAAAGIAALAAACLAAVPGLLAGSAPAGVLAAALVPIGASATMAAVGLTMVCAALPAIASNAQPAADGLRALAQSVSDSAPQLVDAVPAFESMSSSVSAMSMSAALAVASLSALAASASQAASSMNGLQAAEASVSGTASSAFSNISASATESFGAAVDAAQTACASINAAIASLVSKTIYVNVDAGSVKLPHFDMSGSFDPQTGQVPSVSVRWYKTGSIFKKPTIFGGIGEDVPEAAVPLKGQYMRPFAKAVAGEMDFGESVVNNYNIRLAIDSSVGARQITREIAQEIKMRDLMRG